MFDFSSAELTAWLVAHEQWILVGIAATAFLESLAIVGVVVPGVAMLFGAAAAAGSADFDMFPVLTAAFIGAVLGDGVSFFIGRHYHEFIKKLPPFRNNPQWIDKGERFFQRYGLISVVIGRFVGPIRPVLPLVAGMLEMAPSRFLTINMISALGWAPLYILPGYFVGNAAEESTLTTQHILFVIVSIIGGWLLGQILWALKTRCIRRRPKIIASALLFTISITGILLLYSQTDNPWLQHLNQHTAHFFMELRHHYLDRFFIGLTELGYFVPMAIWGILVFIALAWQRHWYLAGLWAATTITANFLIKGTKLLFEVPRPQLIYEPLPSYAFPSGHTCIVIVFFFLILTFSTPALSFRWQKPLVSGAAILAGLMALSRLYLGVHWLSDILAGLLLAITICSAVVLVLLYKPFAAPNPKPLMLACLAALAINLIGLATQWPSLAKRYQPVFSNQIAPDKISNHTK
ncbi:MAG: bifunctional DedA family/phosphatase PAP2 family protein [Ketobacteraceae bacterium]|nr:bifunctional DedA family/phosphatase PAP2 family protein [Ketobacteraceae bacterium]